ncbi:hypothetical protein D049_3710A, partial [Vibrio parahaemolyticus VPTS-2010]
MIGLFAHGGSGSPF